MLNKDFADIGVLFEQRSKLFRPGGRSLIGSMLPSLILDPSQLNRREIT